MLTTTYHSQEKERQFKSLASQQETWNRQSAQAAALSAPIREDAEVGDSSLLVSHMSLAQSVSAKKSYTVIFTFNDLESITLVGCLQAARALQREGRHAAAGPDLRPVFRSAPFVAEGSRPIAGHSHARILFVDEGNCCRYILSMVLSAELTSAIWSDQRGNVCGS